MLSTPAPALEAQHRAARELQARYEALGNGESDALCFSASEVKELIDWFQRRVCGGDDLEGDEDKDSDEGESDDAPIFDGEDRRWTGPEVQEQLALLCEAAGCDWREKLYYVLYERQHELEKRSSKLAEAREQVAYNRILGMDELNRLTLYERQILATLKHLVNQLERHQARRLGQPVAAPVALDVTLSHHGNQSEIP